MRVAIQIKQILYISAWIIILKTHFQSGNWSIIIQLPSTLPSLLVKKFGEFHIFLQIETLPSYIIQVTPETLRRDFVNKELYSWWLSESF